MSPTFTTLDGFAVPAVTSEQMREVDRVAVEETGPTLYQMMENAGRNLAQHVMRTLGPDWREHRIVVLAGSGGNGGGGICSARHLANREGDVTVVAPDAAAMGEVPRQQLEVFGHAGGRTLNQPGDLDAALVVDALIGYSLREAPRGRVSDLIAWAEVTRAPIVSLDIPSGVDATTGETPGAHVGASSTVTLALPKTGLGDAAGDVWLADIGIPRRTYIRAGLDVPPGLFGDEYLIRLVMH